MSLLIDRGDDAIINADRAVRVLVPEVASSDQPVQPLGVRYERRAR
jgi:hypothetical protein